MWMKDAVYKGQTQIREAVDLWAISSVGRWNRELNVTWQRSPFLACSRARFLFRICLGVKASSSGSVLWPSAARLLPLPLTAGVQLTAPVLLWCPPSHGRCVSIGKHGRLVILCYHSVHAMVVLFILCESRSAILCSKGRQCGLF